MFAHSWRNSLEEKNLRKLLQAQEKKYQEYISKLKEILSDKIKVH